MQYVIAGLSNGIGTLASFGRKQLPSTRIVVDKFFHSCATDRATELRMRMREIAAVRVRYGCRKILVLLLPTGLRSACTGEQCVGTACDDEQIQLCLCNR